MKRAGIKIIKYTRRYCQRFFYMAINIRQTSATRERQISNARHRVGDGDGCQTAAIPERRLSNALHGVADGDGGQTAAFVVFAKCFISTICTLNGRKVMT